MHGVRDLDMIYLLEGFIAQWIQAFKSSHFILCALSVRAQCLMCVLCGVLCAVLWVIVPLLSMLLQ